MNPSHDQHVQHDRDQDGGSQQNAPDFWRSRYALGFAVIGAGALYFLLTEHRAHFFNALPLLMLLACPLMHVFMHGGHGGHGGHAGQAKQGSGEGHACCPPRPG